MVSIILFYLKTLFYKFNIEFRQSYESFLLEFVVHKNGNEIRVTEYYKGDRKLSRNIFFKDRFE
jgi:hypothetical protein